MQKSSDFYKPSIGNYFPQHQEEVQAVFLPVIQETGLQVTLEIFLQVKDLQWDLVAQVDPEVQEVHPQVQAICLQAAE